SARQELVSAGPAASLDAEAGVGPPGWAPDGRTAAVHYGVLSGGTTGKRRAAAARPGGWQGAGSGADSAWNRAVRFRFCAAGRSGREGVGGGGDRGRPNLHAAR